MLWHCCSRDWRLADGSTDFTNLATHSLHRQAHSPPQLGRHLLHSFPNSPTNADPGHSPHAPSRKSRPQVAIHLNATAANRSHSAEAAKRESVMTIGSIMIEHLQRYFTKTGQSRRRNMFPGFIRSVATCPMPKRVTCHACHVL